MQKKKWIKKQRFQKQIQIIYRSKEMLVDFQKKEDVENLKMMKKQIVILYVDVVKIIFLILLFILILKINIMVKHQKVLLQQLIKKNKNKVQYLNQVLMMMKKNRIYQWVKVTQKENIENLQQNLEKAQQIQIIKEFKTKEISIQNFYLIETCNAEGQTKPSESFCNILQNNQIRQHPLIIAMNSLIENPNTKLKNCDQIFAKFLIEISKKCEKVFYSMIALIIRGLREMLNLYGYILITKLNQSNQNLRVTFKGNPEQDVFTEKENTTFIGITYDFFIKRFLPSYLNTDDYGFDFVCQFLIQFNQWLEDFNLTQVKTDFNSF